MPRLVTISLAILTLGLAACGMKGPLELPPKAHPATASKGGDVSTHAAPSSSAPSATQSKQP